VKTCREHGIVAERLYGEREILLPGTDEALTVTVPSDDVGL
jgi:hypothetical protein